ncbi:MAG: DNA polymerase IV [Desulfitobacteriia bacterium]|jgi:DNA polymerase-4
MRRRVIFHIDANSAYLSWEAVRRLQRGEALDLRTVPAVIGGDPKTRQGIVLAKSIPTKKYGIKTGETIFSAKAKCPDLLIISPDYYLYKQCSTALGEAIKDYSPLVEQYSVDEYFLDYTGLEKAFGPPLDAAYHLKEQIKDQLGFTVNIGISSNKLLAKMGSELKKPDQVHTLFPEEVSSKMWPLPVEKLFGVGKASSAKLRSRGIQTIGDLAKTDPYHLTLFLKSYGRLLWNFANGYDESPVRQKRRVLIKGIGNSTTLPFNIEDYKKAHLVLLSLAESVAARLRRAEYLAQLVSVSIRTRDFYSYSHQKKIFNPTDSTNDIYQIAVELFDEVWKGEPLRHLGLRVSELCTNSLIQPSLFDRDFEKRRAVDKTVDKIREQFGLQAVIRASFLQSRLKPITGGIIVDEEYPLLSAQL